MQLSLYYLFAQILRVRTPKITIFFIGVLSLLTKLFRRVNSIINIFLNFNPCRIKNTKKVLVIKNYLDFMQNTSDHQSSHLINEWEKKKNIRGYFVH